MTEFYASSNNGITAIISKEHAKLYGLIKKAQGKPPLAGCRIFTFGEKNHIENDPMAKMLMTGSIEDLAILLHTGEHTISEPSSDSGWNGYVPFSAGTERGLDCDAKNLELLYVTTLSDVIAAFGISAITGK